MYNHTVFLKPCEVGMSRLPFEEETHLGRVVAAGSWQSQAVEEPADAQTHFRDQAAQF